MIRAPYPRLGEIDAVLVGPMHGDHVGAWHTSEVDAGECGAPDLSVLTSPDECSTDRPGQWEQK